MSQLKESKYLINLSFDEIKIATETFQDCIGKGGYGMVYKGELIISGIPTKVAVKRLNELLGQGSKEFLTEIQILSGKKHPNLIYLLGYCDDGKEKILLYEYAEHGSLDRYLKRSETTRTLTWFDRLKICVDAARGLDYLHNHVGNLLTIIHRDIKSANILLDENWVAKVSDLGLSTLSLASADISAVISHICGTPGYCEPEYIETNIVKKESDVFSFGIVLFEILCGRLCNVKGDDDFLLSSSTAKEYCDEKKLKEIVDPSLLREVSLESIHKLAKIAYGCLQDQVERSSISVVLKELEALLKFQSFPVKDDGKESEPVSSEKSQSSSSQYYLERELRLDKVTRIFRQFDLNKDARLNREELKSLLVATNFGIKRYSQEQLSKELDDIYRSHYKFIDGEKGLTCTGLLQIYDNDKDSDLDFDYRLLGLDNHNKPNCNTRVRESRNSTPPPSIFLSRNHHTQLSNSAHRTEKVTGIFHKFDMNKDGGLNAEELAAFIVATSPGVRYSEEEIGNCIDIFYILYEKYIDGEKGLTVGGLLLSYDQAGRDLDHDYQALVLNPNQYIKKEEIRQFCLITLTAVLMLCFQCWNGQLQESFSRQSASINKIIDFVGYLLTFLMEISDFFN